MCADKCVCADVHLHLWMYERIYAFKYVYLQIYVCKYACTFALSPSHSSFYPSHYQLATVGTIIILIKKKEIIVSPSMHPTVLSVDSSVCFRALRTVCKHAMDEICAGTQTPNM